MLVRQIRRRRVVPAIKVSELLGWAPLHRPELSLRVADRKNGDDPVAIGNPETRYQFVMEDHVRSREAGSESESAAREQDVLDARIDRAV